MPPTTTQPTPDPTTVQVENDFNELTDLASRLNFATNLIQAPYFMKLQDRTFQNNLALAVTALIGTISIWRTPGVPVTDKIQTTGVAFGFVAAAFTAWNHAEKKKDTAIATAALNNGSQVALSSFADAPYQLPTTTTTTTTQTPAAEPPQTPAADPSTKQVLIGDIEGIVESLLQKHQSAATLPANPIPSSLPEKTAATPVPPTQTISVTPEGASDAATASQGY